MPVNYPPISALIDARLPTWLRRARRNEIVRFERCVVASQRAARQVQRHLAKVAPLETFAKQLLEPAVRQWYRAQALPSVEQGWLWDSARQRDMSWLEAALQNYPPGADVRLAQSRHGQILPLDGKRFVDGVRSLDIGGRYQQQLRDNYANDSFRALLADHDRTALASELVIADLRGLLDPSRVALGEALVQNTQALHPLTGKPTTLQCNALRIFDTILHGPMLIRPQPDGREQACILYLPGEATPLRGYPSAHHAAQALTKLLRNDRSRANFSRYVAQADQPQFFQRLSATLFPSYPYRHLHPKMPILQKGDTVSWIERMFPPVGAIWQETLDANARLPMELVAWAGDCFAARAKRSVQRLLADARALAVPTAQRDAEALQAQIEHWLSVGLTVLNLASLPLEILQLPMLVVGGAQLVGEFLDGIHAANDADADAALQHLFAIIQSLVQFAAIGSASGFSEPTGALNEWLAVDNSKGSRLWRGDLTPFARTPPWPKGMPLASSGLRHWAGEHWVQLGEHAFALESADKGGWRLQAAPGIRHQPRLRGSNGQGAWLLEHENPASWDSATLMRRLGAPTEGLDDNHLQWALQASGYDASMLRRLHVEHMPAPALLLDSLEAYGAQPLAAPRSAPPGDAMLARQFPALSSQARWQILFEAAEADRQILKEGGRLPLAIAETARLYQREGRINRALQAFHQGQAEHPDRDLVALTLAPRLSAWDPTLRIELRHRWQEGQLLIASGPEQSPASIVVRDAHGYRPVQDGTLSIDRVDVFQALYDAMPAAQRERIGTPSHLRDTLFDLACENRDDVAAALGMTRLRRLVTLPTRLQDGRVGYLLSGRGQGRSAEDELFDRLYPADPHEDREPLRQRLRAQAGDAPGAFAGLLQAQQADFERLDASLRAWLDATTNDPVETFEVRRAARSEAAQRIRQAWRGQIRPQADGGPELCSLELNAEQLAELPTLTIRLEQVRALEVTQLQELDESHLDAFLRAFPNLRNLTLAYDRLNDLPQALGELRQLRSLDLTGNRLHIDNAHNLGVLTRLSRLERLRLNGGIQSIEASSLQRLSSLQHLSVLMADTNYLTFEADHFQALQQWPALRHLSLMLNDITLTEQSRAALHGLDGLETLFLSDNPLELAPDITGWHQLRRLDLEDTALTDWPAGIEALLHRSPLQLREIDLSSNLLTEAPELSTSTFAEAIRAGEDVEYNFSDNPFSEAAMQRLADAGVTPTATLAPSGAWRPTWPEHLQSHVATTDQDPHWQPLYGLFERLQNTPDYISHPLAMNLRMQHVVTTLAGLEPGLRDVPGWGRAALQQQINDLLEDAGQHCVDQAELLFQQVETQTTVWRAVATAPEHTQDVQVAVDTATALMRQQRLDLRIGDLFNARVARRRALATEQGQVIGTTAPALDVDDDLGDAQLTDPNFLLDEVEMILDARMQLGERLALPAQPEQIMFGHLAQLSPATLERLAAGVETYVDPTHLADWAAEQAFWQAWMRRLYGDRFSRLANQWAAASEYFDTLSESGPADIAHDGPAVPAPFIDALQAAHPDIAWRRNGVLQRVDLVSGRYPDEQAIYLDASRLLLQTRASAEAALVAQLTALTLNQG
ncbi:dermonecrotic toxin domain-containing protein [Pseudomonas sp. NPDC089752]|uniref:dermonecrotic toxin domain-containing protein n=1 Tax=Pseudomonas sp. NPDC089752 TaxID=3364472 RepID=UPI003829CADA